MLKCSVSPSYNVNVIAYPGRRRRRRKKSSHHKSILAVVAKQLDITVVVVARPSADSQRMGGQDELAVQRLALDRFESAL